MTRDTIEPGEVMTGNQGVKISDDQNSLKAGGRGPTLMEDFHLREKITHFDHERIPSRTFFGFVAPIGADLTPTVDAFRSFFKSQGYRVIEIKVTGVFGILEKYVRPKKTLIHKTPLKDRYETYIAYGNQLREKFGDSILATTTIRRVLAKRLKLPQEGEIWGDIICPEGVAERFGTRAPQSLVVGQSLGWSAASEDRFGPA